MIASYFHEGSGLGNQLHRYVMTRVLALDRGCAFGMIRPENFKGQSFMPIDMGVPVDLLEREEHWEFNETKVINEDGNDVRGYSDLWTVQDNTIIDGEFQGEEYYKHQINEIREWLKVEPLEAPDDLCIIGFRGGEYVGVYDLFLPHSYWHKAIEMMKEKYPNIRFQVHTDDVLTAKEFFPDFECIHDMSLNWRSVRYAKHLIIANSSFFILPSLLGNAVEIIAPKFWAGYNKGYWQLEQNQYQSFTYIEP